VHWSLVHRGQLLLTLTTALGRHTALLDRFVIFVVNLIQRLSIGDFKMNSKTLISHSASLFLFAGVAFAQTSPSTAAVTDLSKPKVPKGMPEEKVMTGIIASTAGQGQSGAVQVETGGASPGDDTSAISGGVSNMGGKCSATLRNASEKNSYRVSFDVIGIDKRGRRAMRKGYSGRIAPKGDLTKTFSCKPDHTMQLKLKSAVKG
jgi:hypothetical protein